jgi:hypothetical protein
MRILKRFALLFAILISALAINPAISQTSCTTVKDCAQIAVEAAQAARGAADRALPAGAVIAFNRPQCPEGWTPYANARGRTIVGVSAAGEETAGLRFVNWAREEGRNG